MKIKGFLAKLHKNNRLTRASFFTAALLVLMTYSAAFAAPLTPPSWYFPQIPPRQQNADNLVKPEKKAAPTQQKPILPAQPGTSVGQPELPPEQTRQQVKQPPTVQPPLQGQNPAAQPSQPSVPSSGQNPEQPAAPGGGGFGGGGMAGGPVPPIPALGSSETKATGIGTIAYNPAQKSLVYQVEAAKVLDALQAEWGKAENVEISVGRPAEQVGMSLAEQVILPFNVLAKLQEQSKGINIRTEKALLEIPKATLPIFTAAGTTQIRADFVPLDSAAVNSPAGFKLAGTAVEVSLKRVDGNTVLGKLESFPVPLELSLTYDNSISAQDRLKLGIYRKNELTGNWEYVGGKLDPKNGLVSVKRGNLSSYALMLYDKTFADLKGHWAKGDVEVMAARHIASGVSNSMFGPDQTITRAQFATLVVKTLGIKEDKTQLKFKDVRSGDWFAGTVGAAYQAGLVSGYSDGSFRPQASITRQEMAAMLAKALALRNKLPAADGSELQNFQDRDKIAAWAKKSSAEVVKSGLIGGRTPQEFAPLGKATRAEATVMLRRLLGYIDEL